MHATRSSRQDKAQRRGAAVVEMALVLPVFLAIVFGIVEFGRAMMVGQLITNASRHGARLAVIDGATNVDVIDSVKTYVSNTVGIDVSLVDVTINITPAPGNPDPANNLALAVAKDVCEVVIQVDYSDVGYITGDFLEGTMLTGRCSMRHE